MKFEQGYKWFAGVAFAAGVICCFFPQRPETAAPAYTYPPATESPTGSTSQDDIKLPEPDSGYSPTKKHDFDEYDCTLDCSGHTAGYEWAERKSISDGYDCDVAGDHYNSPSFAEGCRAYVDGEPEPDGGE
jgi:hypothetical protein